MFPPITMRHHYFSLSMFMPLHSMGIFFEDSIVAVNTFGDDVSPCLSPPGYFHNGYVAI